MLTQERLKKLLYYDPVTGVFTWKISPNNRVKIGDIAANCHTRGYKQIRIDSKSYLSHRLAWLYMTGRWPVDQIDHINRNKVDNRWINLRESNNSGNAKNKKAYGVSGCKGVYPHIGKNPWRAMTKINGKTTYLGSFPTIEQASAAYKKAVED